MNRMLSLLAVMLLALLMPVQALADTVYESNMILINKEWHLPSDYEPSDLSKPDVAYASGVAESKKQMRAEAARALESMFSAALKDGIELLAISGYRSYYTQRDIYNRRLAEAGLEYVSRYIAEPGASEHQTGLAMDLGCPGCVDLSERFTETDAYRWLEQHAQEHGFIIRYPQGGEAETGYAFEPWHVRYVGAEAEAIAESGLTLETYVEKKLRTVSFAATLPHLFAPKEQAGD